MTWIVHDCGRRFRQRRKTLRAALSLLGGVGACAEQILVAAGIAPTERGEKLDIHGFIRIAEASLTIPAEPVAGSFFPL